MIVFAGNEGRWKYEDGVDEELEAPRLLSRLLPGAA